MNRALQKRWQLLLAVAVIAWGMVLVLGSLSGRGAVPSAGAGLTEPERLAWQACLEAVRPHLVTPDSLALREHTREITPWLSNMYQVGASVDATTATGATETVAFVCLVERGAGRVPSLQFLAEGKGALKPGAPMAPIKS